MPVLGVTGGIATGKSSFVRALERWLPGQVFDADRTAHELLDADPAVQREIREAFGDAVFSAEGKPDRSKLRSIVFSDELQRQRLEQILHPVIRARWVSLAAAHQSAAAWLFLDIPLLYETGAESSVDRVAVVACSAETQFERLKEKRALPPPTARSIIAAQMDLGMKIKKAHHVIWNDFTEACLDRQARLFARWLQKCYG